MKLRTMSAREREQLETWLTRRWLDLRGCFDERSRRLWLAVEARSLGYDGAFVASVTKVAEDRVADGVKELTGEVPLASGVRRPGAGRKRAKELDPGLPSGTTGSPGPSYPFDASTQLLAVLARPPVRQIAGVRFAMRPQFDVTPEPCNLHHH